MRPAAICSSALIAPLSRCTWFESGPLRAVHFRVVHLGRSTCHALSGPLSWCRVQGSGFRVQGFRFGVWGLEWIWGWGLGFRGSGVGFPRGGRPPPRQRTGFGFRIPGFGFRESGVGFRGSGSEAHLLFEGGLVGLHLLLEIVLVLPKTRAARKRRIRKRIISQKQGG